MKKNLVNSMCTLLVLFCSQAIAADQKAPRVCNAAETAKVCKGWSDETKLVLDGPESDRFHSALAACAGPDNYGQQGPQQQLYIDCQDKADIVELRLKVNAADDAKRSNFSWMRTRCSPQYAKNRVCGTSVDSTVSSAKDDSKKDRSSPLLTRTPSRELTSAQKAEQKAKDESDSKARTAAELAKTKAASDKALSNAKAAGDKQRAWCKADQNRHGLCGCTKFFPDVKYKVCGK